MGKAYTRSRGSPAGGFAKVRSMQPGTEVANEEEPEVRAVIHPALGREP